MQNGDELPADQFPSDRSPLAFRGQWVIAGMFAFAIVMTAVLFLYWEMHTAKFRSLQEAIAVEFPTSRPRVEGGRHKGHKGGPSILRIVMKVEFNPKVDTQAADQIVDRLWQISDQTGYLHSGDYDQFEVHLFWPEPEQEIIQTEITRPISPLTAEETTATSASGQPSAERLLPTFTTCMPRRPSVSASCRRTS